MSDVEQLNNWSFLGLLKDTPIPERQRAALWDTQVYTVSQLVGIIVLVGMINTFVVTQALRSVASPLFLAWGYGLFILNGMTYLRDRKARRLPPGAASSERIAKSITRIAFVHGFFWGILPWTLPGDTSELHFLLIGIVAAGMMFGGAFLLSRLPAAAISFVAPVGAGLFSAFMLHGGLISMLVGMLVLIYVFVLIYMVRWTHRQFTYQFLSESGMREQAELIRMMLLDFDSGTSDWLWQTDTNYVLEEIPVSTDLKQDNTGAMRVGRRLQSCFLQDDRLDELETRLSNREAFKNIVLKLDATEGPARWISLTGKPTIQDGVCCGYRGVAADVTHTKEIEDHFRYIAKFDELTGLPNRASLLDRLQTMADALSVSSTSGALILLELDQYKWVRDTYGLSVADELVRHMARRLNEILRHSDFIARIGGGKFAIVAQLPSEDSLTALLDQLAAEMHQPCSLWNVKVNCTGSIGVRCFDLLTREPSTLLKQAGFALHNARSLARGHWSIYTPELETQVLGRKQIEQELQDALETSQLFLVYQPKVDARTHALVGFEALIRWRHPERGMISPAEFVPLAEETRQISRIGEWVIRTALEDATRLPGHLRISINVSPVQLQSPAFVSTIINALAATQVAPERIELEVTESVLMFDAGTAFARLKQLRDLGLSISLDDFGTGYASLSYIRKFPFNKIKIDQSFVRDISTNPESRAIIVAVIGLAKELGLTCTAEGVETNLQADFLVEHGCDELQGQIISCPKSLAQLAYLYEPVSMDESLQTAVQPAPDGGAQNPFLTHARQARR